MNVIILVTVVINVEVSTLEIRESFIYLQCLSETVLNVFHTHRTFSRKRHF